MNGGFIMDIRQLTYFLEVARQQSMTKAAEVLHVSQPALSKMVKGLEEELGYDLNYPYRINQVK